MARSSTLPPPSPTFEARKTRILQQLAVPDAEYADASPKGTVDAAIRPLLGRINDATGFVTTSSCAGRVSVFAQGRRTTTTVAAAAAAAEIPAEAAGSRTVQQQQEEDGAGNGNRATVAGLGGKGGGGTWLYVSHEPHPLLAGRDEGHDAAAGVDWARELGFASREETMTTTTTTGRSWDAATGDGDDGAACWGKECRWIHFKFEPMILHVLTASPAHAQLLLRCALHAGFRESGAVSLVPPPASEVCKADSPTTTAAMPMVAVRSMGLGFESLVGYVNETNTTTTTTDDDDDDDDDGNGNGNDGRRRRRRRRRRHQLLVPPGYLDTLMRIGRERFAENTKRIQRFEAAFRDAIAADDAAAVAAVKSHPGILCSRLETLSSAHAGYEWQDAAARRARMRAEGLQRKAAIQAEKAAAAGMIETEVDFELGDLVIT